MSRYLNQPANWGRWGEYPALGLAVALSLGVLWSAGDLFLTGDEPPAIADPRVDPSAAAESADRPDPVADRLTEVIVTSPLMNVRAGVRLTGVLGHRAYFSNGAAIEVGESVGEMKLLEIGPDWVEVEEKSAKRRLYVFGAPRPNQNAGRPTGPADQVRARPSAVGSAPPVDTPGAVETAEASERAPGGAVDAPTPRPIAPPAVEPASEIESNDQNTDSQTQLEAGSIGR